MLETVSAYRLMSATAAVGISQTAPVPDTATQNADKLKVAREAVETLKKARADQDDNARSLAQAKVFAVLERIRALKAMKGSDPVQTARVIAQLTKDLRAALKAYLATGGKASDIGNTNTPATSSEATPKPDPAAKVAEVKTPINPYAPPGQPLPEDASFLNSIRELIKALKALLLREVNKAKSDPKADAEPFEAAKKEIDRLEKEIDSAHRDLAQAALATGTQADVTV